MNLIKKTKGVSNLAASIANKSSAPSPIYMQIEPTNLCNLDCIMCLRKERNLKNQTLSLSDFKKIIDTFPSLALIQLSGLGEPLLNQNFEDMVIYAKAKGIEVETTSNMTICSKGRAKKIVESGLDRVFISIDSVVPEIYKKIRGVDLELPKNAATAISDWKKEFKSSTPKIIINYVVMKENIDGLKEVVDFASKIGADVNFKKISIAKKENEDREVDDYYEKVSEAEEHGKKLGVKIIRTAKLRPKKGFYCYRVWFGAFIDAGGNLLPCCEFYSSPCLGNILQTGKEPWNGKDFKEFRRWVRNKGKKESFSNETRATCAKCNLVFNDTVRKIDPLKFIRH